MKKLSAIAVALSLAAATPVSAQEAAGAQTANALQWIVPLVVIGAIIAASGDSEPQRIDANLTAPK